MVVQRGWLALLVLMTAVVIPAKVSAHADRSYARPSTSSSSYRRRRHNYKKHDNYAPIQETDKPTPNDLARQAGAKAAFDDHSAGLLFDIERHAPERDGKSTEFAAHFTLGYEKTARRLLREPGKLAAAGDIQAQNGFDISRHLDAIRGKSERAQEAFRDAYRDQFQQQRSATCIHAYFYPEDSTEKAYDSGSAYGIGDYGIKTEEDVSYQENQPLCEQSVLTPEQEKAFRRGYSEYLREQLANVREYERKREARESEVSEDDIFLWGVLAAFVIGILLIIRKARR